MEPQLLLPVLIMIAVPALIWLLYWLYFRNAGKALISALIAFGLGLGAGRLYEDYLLRHYGEYATWVLLWIGQADGIHYRLALFGSFLTIIFILPLVVMAYERWLKPPLPGDQEDTPEALSANSEQSPAGDKGWLRFWAFGTILSLWLSVGMPTYRLLEISAHANLSPWAWVLIVLAALAAWPFYRMLTRNPEPAIPADDIKEERDRVLRLLEEKRITAEECAELLTALGESRRPEAFTPVGTPIPATRKLLLAGAVLVLIGFLLPWFNIDAKQLMDAVQQQLKSLPFMSNGTPSITYNGMPGIQLNEQSPLRIVLNGADIARGYGWVILLAALIAAILPFFVFRVPASGRRWLLLLPLLVGSAILLYLLAQNFSFISFGLVVVIVGYGLEYAGVLRERQV